MQLITRNLIVLSGLVFSVACGGDDDDKASGPVASGVAKDKQLSALTQAEAEQLSKSYAESLNVPELIRGMCTLTSVFASAFAPMDSTMPAPSCEELTQQCVDAAKTNPTVATSGNAASLPTATTGYAGCTVTVGELEACLTASLEMMTTAFSSIKCDADPMAMESSGAVDTSIGNITECKTLTASCPMVLADPAGGDIELDETSTQ